MKIHTVEENFDYQVKRALKQFKKQFDLEETGEDLYEKIWQDKNLCQYFGQLFLDTIMDFDEGLFEE